MALGQLRCCQSVTAGAVAIVILAPQVLFGARIALCIAELRTVLLLLLDLSFLEG